MSWYKLHQTINSFDVQNRLDKFLESDLNFRIWDGDEDGDTIIDMGAYEYGSPLVGIDSHSENNISKNDTFKLYPNPSNQP